MKMQMLYHQKLNLFLVILFLYGSQSIYAQKTFSAQQCVEYAFMHNPLLQASSTDTAISDLDIKRVTGLYLPRVNFGAAVQYFITKRNLLVEGGTALAPSTVPSGEPYAIPVGYNNTWFPTLSVNQLIFDPSYRNSYNIASQNRILQQQEIADFKIGLVSGIYKAYSACRLLEVQAKFLVENIKRIDTLIELTRVKFKEGAGIKIEVNRVEVTGNRMRSALANVRNSFAGAMLGLQFQMNYLEKDSMILSDAFSIPQILSVTDPIMQELLLGDPAKRIESQMLKTQIALADESIKLERARKQISIGADGQLGFTPAANSIDKIFQGERWKPYSYVGVSVFVPIFNGSDVNRAVEQKKFQASQVRNYFDQFTSQFENEKKTVFYQIKNAREKFLYAETNLKLAENNIYLLHEAFVNGVADNQDLILGENDLYENQARYYDELLQLLLSQIEGRHVTGSFNTIVGLSN
ncbi:MAG: TolC family protein [Bacteroidetes bacterium]|nr:MAG: TolC family protein [Bacteroidota bacterium]